MRNPRPDHECTRCGSGPIGELCCQRVSMLEELNIRMHPSTDGKQNDGLESVAFVGFSTNTGAHPSSPTASPPPYHPAGKHEP